MLGNYILVFILGGLPISEIRGAIIYGLGANLNIPLTFLLGAIGNMLAVPLIFFALDRLKLIRLAKKLFGRRAYATIEKNKARLDRWGELALLMFVAIPLPITGAWMGSLIASMLEMDKKKSFVVISLGIIIAGLITLGVGQGVLMGLTSLL